jgi:hypothetical protein
MEEADHEKPPVFDSVVAEDTALEKLGYQPELKRDFSLIGITAFSFSIVTSWSALSGVLVIGVESGGPPVMVWSWIGICAASLAVAYSMAEMCSAYPVAGGQYSCKTPFNIISEVQVVEWRSRSPTLCLVVCSGVGG